jgi:putative transport protein
MDYVVAALRTHPELAIFLTLAAGFALGHVRIRSFRVGSVLGTLLAGVLVGQLEIKVPPIIKDVFFDLFLFATGYKVGPQFIRGLGKSALPQVALTVVLCVTSPVAAVLATAGDAIGRLGLSQSETEQLHNNIAVAYAVTYLVGTTAVVWFLSSGAPRLLRLDLKAEAQKLERDLAGGLAGPDGLTSYREWDVRAYRVGDRWAGRRVEELERSFQPERVFVERIRRGEELVNGEPGMTLQAGDIVAVTARRRVVAGDPAIGTEVEDRALLEFPIAALDVVVTRKAVVDRSLASLADEYGRGVALLRLERGGEQIPFAPSTTLNRGDMLRLTGASRDVERAGRAIGYIERPTESTDVVFVGLGIVVGGLIGLLSVKIGGLPITLTSSGGALIMGLVFGWLRSVYPTFGRIPEPALWVFDTIGLAVFIGVVGIGAGPGFVDGLRRAGVMLAVVGLMVAFAAHLAAVLFGRFVLKMNPVVLLGACAGAGTSTAALRSIQDEAQSKVPVLGYTVPYALGNILLTAWGPVIVLLTR